MLEEFSVFVSPCLIFFSLLHSILTKIIAICGAVLDSLWFSERLYYSSIRQLVFHHNVLRGFLGLQYQIT